MKPSLAPRNDEPSVAHDRVRLDPVMARRGALDGGWWPRSRNATVELPALAAAMNERRFHVTRLTVDPGDWDDIPHRGMTVGDRTIRVGKIPGLEHQIIVTCGRNDDLMLLVVPPHIAPDAAERALNGAAAGLASLRPNDVLERSRHPWSSDE